MLDRRAEREYNRLVDAAVDAVPADAPGMLRKVMGPDIKQALTYGAKNHSQELRLMAHLWALMGYQEAVRRLCEALIFNGVHCTEGPDAPNSASRAALSWPAEYTNLIGYAHLFNRTTTADHDLAKEFDPSYSSEFEGTRELMGTPDRPGPAFWTVGKDLVRIVLGEMAEMSIYRLSSVGNDIGWDRARFDQELETDAHAMRVVLADSNQRPTLSQDLNINLPEGFTGFHDNIGPNEPVPELRHLPPPQPLPVGLFPAGWFTAPDPAATPGDTGSSEAAGDVPISEPERQGPLPPMNPKDIGSVWDHIEALLGDDAEDMLNPGADDDSISDLEARLGRELPAPMRKSLERHNGMTEEHEALPGPGCSPPVTSSMNGKSTMTPTRTSTTKRATAPRYPSASPRVPPNRGSGTAHGSPSPPTEWVTTSSSTSPRAPEEPTARSSPSTTTNPTPDPSIPTSPPSSQNGPPTSTTDPRRSNGVPGARRCPKTPIDKENRVMKLKPTASRNGAQPWLEDLTGAEFTKPRWYGASLSMGLLQIHDAESGPEATQELQEAFGEEADGLPVFATDWLGRHYAAGTADQGAVVVRADIASAELKAIGSLEGFLTGLRKDRKADEFFDKDSFRAVRNHTGLRSLPFDQCASFKTPPFLGGEITLDNIEIAFTSVHWSLFGQIYQQVKDLPPGSPIPEIKVEGQ
nr:T6SS immunity protein Tdi1 domain-containing protein [Galactobacter sp.]